MADKEASSKDQDVIATAKERFEYALERESHNRKTQKDDIRFAAASPDDPWQWDDNTVRDRRTTGRPMLTINKLPQHIRQVTNDIRQNRPSIRYRPADDKADPEVADILMGLVRHIEAHSDADTAYDTCSEHQVTSGEGFLRVMADYVNDDSFDQDIFIKRVGNQFRVHMDPDIQDPAGGDARWCFIDEELDEDEFKAQYPNAAPIEWNFVEDTGWFTSGKKVRIVEYFEIVEKEATLCMYASGATAFKDDKKLPDGVIPGEKPIKERKAVKKTCVWRKLNGQQILEGGAEGKPFPSRYIPVARAVGNEWEVEGKKYVSGIVRNAKDSQRMYNVAQSAIVERVMQAPKAPWVAPAEAIEGYEKEWQSANTANHSFLPYNHVDEAGNPIPTPTRNNPATVETGLNQIAMGASDDIKAETGQYDASLGQKSNETSGKAIMARQREGDNATYHFVDNLGRAIRHIGRVILDMIPAIYDTQRVARILGEDGEVANATVDPKLPQAMIEVQDETGAIKRIFNPNIGFYDVYTTSGPSFTTRRVEAVDAMTTMVQANPQLMAVIGDKMIKAMDWPGAEEMAERMKYILLPPIQESLDKEKGELDIPPQVKQQIETQGQQLQAASSALENMHQEIDKLTQQQQSVQMAADQKAGVEELKRMKAEVDARKAQDLLEIERAQAQVDAYRAETERMQALAPAIDPAQVQAIVQQTVKEILSAPPPGPQTQPMQPPSGGFSLPEEAL
jgi:hypothetical protein